MCGFCCCFVSGVWDFFFFFFFLLVCVRACACVVVVFAFRFLVCAGFVVFVAVLCGFCCCCCLYVVGFVVVVVVVVVVLFVCCCGFLFFRGVCTALQRKVVVRNVAVDHNRNSESNIMLVIP